MKSNINSTGRKIIIPALILSIVLICGLGIFMVRKNNAALQGMMDSKGTALVDFIAKLSTDYYVVFDFRDFDNFEKVLESDPDVEFVVFYNIYKQPLTSENKIPKDISSIRIYDREIKNAQGNVLGYIKLGFRNTALSHSHSENIIILSASIFIALLLFSAGIILNKKNKLLKQEVAERTQAQDALLHARQDWEDTFNTITDMITIHDNDYNIILSNKAAEKMLGLPFLKDAKAKCFKYYHGAESPPEGCPSCGCLKSGEYASFEVFEPHLNKHIEIRAMPRVDRNNRLIGLIHIVRDISDKKKSEEKIQRQVNYLNSLHTIDKAISSSLDMSITLNVLLEQAVNQLKVDAAGVLMLNPHSNYLEYSAGRGFRTDIIKSSLLRLGKGYAGRAALERKPFIITDFAKLPEGVRTTSLIKAEEFKTYIGMPLVAKGKTKGVLEVFHRSDKALDAEWMDFLKTLAGQAAIAIDSAGMVDDLQRTYDEMILAYDTTIEGWSRALDYRDKETEGHSQRVTEFTLKIARAMGVKDEELVHMRRGALLHDIGKLGVPDSILLKPGELNDEEWKIMRRHPVIAYEILSPIPFLRSAINIPYYHHEKWDGTGYPAGLKGEQIPFSARIFALVDIFDALNSDRPYRKAWHIDKVLDYISDISGTHLDPEVVRVFFKVVSQNTVV